jgi:hypothetical protein
MKCAAAKVVSFAGIVCTMSVDFSAGPLFCIMTRACDFDILDTRRAYRIVSYRIVSYRIVSYRIVSYRIVSYRVLTIFRGTSLLMTSL